MVVAPSTGFLAKQVVSGIRIGQNQLEEADQADGCSGTFLAVNSNPGEAKFEPGKNWTWYTPIRITLRGEASYGEREGRQPLGKSAEREWWTWYTPIRTALERPFNFRIYLSKTHEYQRISTKAKQLQAKGLSWTEIARKLKVTDKTAKRAAMKV